MADDKQPIAAAKKNVMPIPHLVCVRERASVCLLTSTHNSQHVEFSPLSKHTYLVLVNHQHSHENGIEQKVLRW